MAIRTCQNLAPWTLYEWADGYTPDAVVVLALQLYRPCHRLVHLPSTMVRWCVLHKTFVRRRLNWRFLCPEFVHVWNPIIGSRTPDRIAVSRIDASAVRCVIRMNQTGTANANDEVCLMLPPKTNNAVIDVDSIFDSSWGKSFFICRWGGHWRGRPLRPKIKNRSCWTRHYFPFHRLFEIPLPGSNPLCSACGKQRPLMYEIHTQKVSAYRFFFFISIASNATGNFISAIFQSAKVINIYPSTPQNTAFAYSGGYRQEVLYKTIGENAMI